MPVPAHRRLTFSGIVQGSAGAVEQWSWRINAPWGMDDPETNSGAMLVACNAGLSAYAARLQAKFPTWIILKQVRHSLHVEGGLVLRTDDGGYAQADRFDSIAGTASTQNRMPLQSAMVVSLDSRRGGPTGKGRVFLPHHASGLDTDCLWPVNTTTIVATDFGLFLKDLRAAWGDCHVMSSKGYSSRVETVRVGRAPDTLRSRRANLVEAYAKVDIP